MVSCASRTVTASPARARVMAAESPFGPEPITNASVGTKANLVPEGCGGTQDYRARLRETRGRRECEPTIVPSACALPRWRNDTRRVVRARISGPGPETDWI